ncbi:hypothetical protein AB0F15_44325 [Amycolatopsis sp. NPDC026612]|uniref:hypothetical protein n=1 Tax=Amycolatopsis sp. NPDC026612 TaxID=3155466 RepID=UPI00340FCFB8
MTLRTDLTGLLADAGLVEVDVDAAVADEHVRWAAYQCIVAVAAASGRRDGDRALVATIVRDPRGTMATAAVVDLVDRIAAKTAGAAGFRHWSAEILSETDRFATEANREFVRRRVREWLFWLSIKDGHVPSEAELAEVTPWMQRLLAAGPTSPPPVLALLAASGATRKIRNIAKNRGRGTG